jgi:hypothetical protein
MTWCKMFVMFLHVVWYLEPLTNVEYAAFQFNGHLFMLHKTCATTGVVFMVTKR